MRKNKSEKSLTSKPLETCYFSTTSHFMATNINFLVLKNFFMLYIASTLPFQADRSDVLHDLL